MASSVAAGLLAGMAASAATGFVVNSDDLGVRDFDSLHRVELSTGQAIKVGAVRVNENSAPFADVEGLAMSPEGLLYGIDDASKTLVRIDLQNGQAAAVDGREGNTGLPRTSNFDFGLTFDEVVHRLRHLQPCPVVLLLHVDCPLPRPTRPRNW